MTYKMIRLPAVIDRTGLGSTSIYTRAKLGLFPPPVKLTARSSAWPEHEIDEFNQAIAAGKTEEELRALVRELVAARKTLPPRVSPAEMAAA